MPIPSYLAYSEKGFCQFFGAVAAMRRVPKRLYTRHGWVTKTRKY